MRELEKGKATICIVNYKTEELTRLCLRSIRKFTKYPYKVVVVDNDSKDSSLEYLRSLKWITLVERGGETIRPGSWAHGSGLDRGLEAAGTEFFVAMHSDVIVHDKNWLGGLANLAESDINTACVGSGKLETKPAWLKALKKATDFKAWIRKLSGNDKDRFYVRAICALYRTEVLQKEGLSFAADTDKKTTCGKKIYFELLKKGYGIIEVPPETMCGYIYHLAHATMVLNPEFKVRKRTEKKCLREITRLMNSPLLNELKNDKSLDL